MKGKVIDKEMNSKRKEIAQIEHEYDILLEIANQELKKVKDE